MQVAVTAAHGARRAAGRHQGRGGGEGGFRADADPGDEAGVEPIGGGEGAGVVGGVGGEVGQRRKALPARRGAVGAGDRRGERIDQGAVEVAPLGDVIERLPLVEAAHVDGVVDGAGRLVRRRRQGEPAPRRTIATTPR